MKIEETEKEIVEEFSMFDGLTDRQTGWLGKYEHIIELGKSLPMIKEEYKTDDRLIKGCQSKVWLHSEVKDAQNLPAGRQVFYTADSDAIITKGLVALVIRVLSGHSPDEIVNAKMEFINQIGLTQHLSPTRANGLVNMIKQMKLDALALKAKV